MSLINEIVMLSELDWDALKNLELKAKRKYEEALKIGSRKIDTYWAILRGVKLAKRLKLRIESN